MKRTPKTLAQLLMTEKAMHNISAASENAHPLETGGVLLGVLAGGTPWVVVAEELPSRDAGRNHYRLPADRTRSAVARARVTDARIGYLGDWHSHPADIEPSRPDIRTLRHLQEVVDGLVAPLIVVARRVENEYTLSGRTINAGAVQTCRIILTGDLPHPLKGATEEA